MFGFQEVSFLALNTKDVFPPLPFAHVTLYCNTFPYSPNTQGFEAGFPRNCLSAISEGLATNYFVLGPKYNVK